MLCSVYTTIAGEYDGPPFCTPIGSTSTSCTIRKIIESTYLYMLV